MNDDWCLFSAFMIGAIIGSLGGFALGTAGETPDRVWKAEAIKHNAAEYDTKTGEFKWIERTEDQP